LLRQIPIHYLQGILRYLHNVQWFGTCKLKVIENADTRSSLREARVTGRSAAKPARMSTFKRNCRIPALTFTTKEA
jgi:hypothetical protein